MSRYLSARHASLLAYTPGEQPKDRRYIKLNTNESPYPPSPTVAAAVAAEVDRLQLYSDPLCRELCAAASQAYGVPSDHILMTNGSDEILQFAFMAFGDREHPFAFASLTYGFYAVFAALHGIPYTCIPLDADFGIRVRDYDNHRGPIVLANPNAPTGRCLPLSDIRYLLDAHREAPVIIDEAYIDFGGQSAVSLVGEYDNLLVTRTFSKSFSMAGARLGFGIAQPTLLRDLDLMKYSTNPYNVNRMTAAAGVAALGEMAYYQHNCRRIVATRERVAAALRRMGFFMTDSQANFLFARHRTVGGRDLYLALRERGILVRHFDTDAICDFNRITIGSDAEMDTLLAALSDILCKKGYHYETDVH